MSVEGRGLLISFVHLGADDGFSWHFGHGQWHHHYLSSGYLVFGQKRRDTIGIDAWSDYSDAIISGSGSVVVVVGRALSE